MALTLTADIAATDRTISITGTVPDSIEAGYAFRLDDELLVLTTFELHDVSHVTHRLLEPNRNRWQVRRGQGGSVADAHSAGATVFGAVDAYTASTTPTPPTVFPAPGGGAEQTVELLGPFDVAFDDDGLADGDGSVNFCTIPAGTIVLRAWLVPLTTWTATDIQGFIIGLATDADEGNFVQITNYVITGGSFDKISTAGLEAEAAFQGAVVLDAPIIAAATVASHLTGEYDADTPTAGTGHIYALIATPS